jgi:hypothetical protein
MNQQQKKTRYTIQSGTAGKPPRPRMDSGERDGGGTPQSMFDMKKRMMTIDRKAHGYTTIKEDMERKV